MEATGGTITTVGNFKVHTFNSSGTFTVTNEGDTGTVESLVIAGGGGGGKTERCRSRLCGAGNGSYSQGEASCRSHGRSREWRRKFAEQGKYLSVSLVRARLGYH